MLERVARAASRAFGLERIARSSGTAVARSLDARVSGGLAKVSLERATDVIATRGVITVAVERGDAERAYKRLRRIMMSEGVYEDLRATTEGHRKPSELRVLARKERERRTVRQRLNSRLGWIMRQKERGF